MNKFELISQVEAELLLEADLEANGAGFSKTELRKVLSLTEADFTEVYDGDELMEMLDAYCKDHT